MVVAGKGIVGGMNGECVVGRVIEDDLVGSMEDGVRRVMFDVSIDVVSGDEIQAHRRMRRACCRSLRRSVRKSVACVRACIIIINEKIK